MSRRVTSSSHGRDGDTPGRISDAAAQGQGRGRVVSGSAAGRGASGDRDSAQSGRSTHAGRGHRRETAKGHAAARSVVSEAGASIGVSEPDGFVDARALPSEDLVAKTLEETTGTLGIASRPKVVDFSARLRERRRASMRTIAVRVIAIVGSIVVVCGLVWLLLFSSVFRLDAAQITVSGGNEWVSEQRIRDIADRQIGKSLFLVSANEVTSQLKDIPGVTDATAGKRFPRGMAVVVKAQKPAAMLKTSTGMTAVDGQGRVLNSVNGASADGIPVIEVSDVDKGLSSRAVRESLKILSSLPENMRKSITKVSAQTQDSITTELNGGDRVIIWGDASQLDLKKAVVDKIINDPTKIGDKHQVDVSAPLRPIIK
ncbi:MULTISPECIES: cell division protein FtsQ/DivIB [Bifidobacterium]|jgi:cell division protein FtsQ|uniref:Cell division protein FtsQ n=1 Tax=Bifidobacterium tibiigranuli TaxID=2172043 RepID=A0A5N6S483_9BIFI|nr:FtsQ-type POTRA domain-containing protein [Bifidobacterium tibiigranuli]KAE8128326.1 cell division protein FtsQ [Bifidobacterium tibiigranuli]KAE8128659.1 cell division protein FtsQ [Bifidobacterium tibiigranuli]MCI1210865.1 FtsQ-type POTRA domain-containing protein [Bifidobacterium tibiigranuli]MCI1221635.1 FtsQ-type POTRA domain-containing protein [Bifidobacterium tibiigranuli]MCI1233091.1 FtsQ-type POTRA domain-containing protein [Bifidobacterium tibiigranuli]